MKLLLTSVLFALLFPILGGAASITSGTITIRPFFSGNSFDFSGPDFSASGVFYDGNWGATFCTPCKIGSELGVNGIVTGGDFGGGSATVGATNFPFVGWTDPEAVHGSAFFVAGPAITVDAGAGSYQSTFSFVGSLCGTLKQESIPRACLVDLLPLTGSGTVDVTFHASPIPGVVEFSNAVYTFTPEPQTWMLALVGIVAVLVGAKVAWRESSVPARISRC